MPHRNPFIPFSRQRFLHIILAILSIAVATGPAHAYTITTSMRPLAGIVGDAPDKVRLVNHFIHDFAASLLVC